MVIPLKRKNVLFLGKLRSLKKKKNNRTIQKRKFEDIVNVIAKGWLSKED